MGNIDDKPKLYSFDSTSSNVSFILHKESVLTDFYAELTAQAVVQPVMKQHSIPCTLLYNDVHEESTILKPQMKYLARCMNEYTDDDVDEEKGKAMTSSESTKVQKLCEKCITVFESKDEMYSSRKGEKHSIKDNNSSIKSNSIKDDTRFNSIHSLNVSNQEQLLNITSTSITIGGSNNNSSKKVKVNVLELPKGICYKKKSISPKRIGKDSISSNANANHNVSPQKQTITSSLASTKNTSLNSSPSKNVNIQHVVRKTNVNTIKPVAMQSGKQTNTKVLNIGTIGNVNVNRRCTSPQMNKHGSYNKGDSSYVAIKMQQQRKLSGNVNHNNNNNNNSKNINVSNCKSKSPKKTDNNRKTSVNKRKAPVKAVFELDLSDLGEDAYEYNTNTNVDHQHKQQQQQQPQLNKGSNVYNNASKLEKLKKLQQQRMNSKNTSSNNSKQFQAIPITTTLPSKVNNDISSQQSIPINYYECDSISISDYLTNNNNNTNQQDSNTTPTEVTNNGTPTSIFSFKKKIHPSVYNTNTNNNNKDATSTFKVNAKLSDTEFKDIEFLN